VVISKRRHPHNGNTTGTSNCCRITFHCSTRPPAAN